MAYVHCHSCPWSQDDFWNKSYNPVRFFFKNELPYALRPRYASGDKEWVRPTRFSQFLHLTRIRKVLWAPKQPGKCDIPSPSVQSADYDEEKPQIVTEYSIFTWFDLLRSMLKWWKRIYHQVWWTDGEWKRELASRGGKWPPCPRCGAHDLDID